MTDDRLAVPAVRIAPPVEGLLGDLQLVGDLGIVALSASSFSTSRSLR